MIESLLFTIGIALIIYVFHKWLTEHHDYFEKKGIPHLKSNYGLGNLCGFFLKRYKPNEFIMGLYKSYPNEKIFGLYDFRNPFVYIRDPDIIKQLAVKEFDHFVDHRSFINDNSDKLFGNSLILLRGQKWRDMRATLSPAFTGSKMRQMFTLVTDCADDLCTFYRNKLIGIQQAGVNVEMKDVFQHYANDVIASCAFGLKVDSNTESGSKFFETAKRFMNLTHPLTALKLVLLRLCPYVMKKFDIQFVASDVRHFFKSLVFDTMNVREKEGIFRPDLINLLMQIKSGKPTNDHDVQTHREDNEKHLDGFATVEESQIGKLTVKREWSDDEIVAQCFLFFIAGFDTTSTVLSFIMYELAVNEDVQDKLYNEIKAVIDSLDGKPINYEALQKMQYMDMVFSESLRKWPPALVTDRACVKKFTLNYDNKKNFTFDEGMAFWIPIYALHHDPQYFPNPDRFDPERFNANNKANINLNAYIPFGVGPRNCIGSRFAIMEIKTIIYYILSNFIILPNAETQIPLQIGKGSIGVITERGIHLEMKLRNDNK